MVGKGMVAVMTPTEEAAFIALWTAGRKRASQLTGSCE